MHMHLSLQDALEPNSNFGLGSYRYIFMTIRLTSRLHLHAQELCTLLSVELRDRDPTQRWR